MKKGDRVSWYNEYEKKRKFGVLSSVSVVLVDGTEWNVKCDDGRNFMLMDYDLQKE